MLNKDKRSIVLSFILGDGCLHYIKSGGKVFGGLTIDHSITQADYQAWKAQMLTHITGRNIKLRTGHNGKSVQISVCMKRFRVWRKFFYPNEKKDTSKILKFINNPTLALAIWLMDDGYVEPSITKNKNYSAAFRIFTCSETMNSQQAIIKWFEKEFQITPSIRWANKKSKNRNYPFLKINSKDSLKIWEIIREFVLQFKSMQYKFRHIEQIYQSRCLQPPADLKSEDIVKQ